VIGLAKVVGAKVSVLNVVRWLSGWHGASEPHFLAGDDVLRKLKLNQRATEASSQSMLEAFKNQYFQSIECDSCIRSGGVAESILEYAREIQADLIMMPTCGMGPPRPFLIGSVTAKVLHDARCAVWTSPHPRELEAFRPYRQIVCAMDYRVLSREFLARASQVARLSKSRFSVVSAIPCPAACRRHQALGRTRGDGRQPNQHRQRLIRTATDLFDSVSQGKLDGEAGTVALVEGDSAVQLVGQQTDNSQTHRLPAPEFLSVADANTVIVHGELTPGTVERLPPLCGLGQIAKVDLNGPVAHAGKSVFQRI
jgi:nucleotide-binding universal stress UspA family protein